MTQPSLQSPRPRAEGPAHGSPERPASPWGKRWLVVALGVAAVALAYGIGRVQGALALTQVEKANALELDARQSRLTACEIDRDLLAARRSLSLVALSLERRNFGVAETHRREALETLRRAPAAGAPEVAPLVTSVEALNLSVDPDPGTKRAQVIAASEELDRVSMERMGRGQGQAVSPAGAASK